MDDNQLKVLEERINKAVNFIETLKAKEKSLADEKEMVERRMEELKEQVIEKEQRIKELMESQVFLKNKIETVLSKLESLANFDMKSSETESEDDIESSLETEEPPVAENEIEHKEVPGRDETEERSSSEIYVEETFVELKDEDETAHEDQGDEASKNDRPSATIVTPQIDQNPLFETEEGEQTGEEESPEKQRGFFKKSKQIEKPFGDNPFLEM
jgi:hypothetical protein